MARQNATLIGLGEAQGKDPKAFTFQDPPLIAAPNTVITDLAGSPRTLPDPAKTLRPAFGNERISSGTIVLKPKERGPAGEPVWGFEGEDRVRFIGATWQNFSGTTGAYPYVGGGTTGEMIEITFYGTGLNILESSGSSRGLLASVDGGAEGANVLPDVGSLLSNRNYRPNIIYPIVANLALGTHTVRLRKSVSGYSLQSMGFEVITSGTQIRIPQGEILANGTKYTNPALRSIDYNTGFDGAPALNGRGGRVVEYMLPTGHVSKAIQQTDLTQRNLTDATHANEELLRSINFREFGANRADDFSTLADAVTDRAFIMDDGTTTLAGLAVRVFTSGGTLAAAPGVYTNGTTTAGGITLTFTGTGLDFVTNWGNSPETTSIYVDGILTGTIPYTANARSKLIKIVSGLPFGSHTVRLERGGGGSDFMNISDFLIYGPKRPTLPTGAVILQEYFLMANFVANATAGLFRISTGVLRKAAQREFLCVNGTGGTNDWALSGMSPANDIGGNNANTNRQNAYFEYTFFGTGFDLRFPTSTAGSANIQVSLQSLSTGGSLQNLTTTNFPSLVSSVYGTGVAFNAATGILDQLEASPALGNGFVVSGLPLALYKVRMLNNTASAYLLANAIDIITPVHYPNVKNGSLSLGPTVQFKSSQEVSGVDLTKAKAWLSFDGVNNLILASKNISAVIRNTGGVYYIFFDKPFKNNKYAEICSGNSFEVASIQSQKFHNSIQIQTANSAGANVDQPFSVVVFGELADEEDV